MKFKRFSIVVLLSFLAFASCTTDDEVLVEQSEETESQDLRLSLLRADFQSSVNIINDEAIVTFINRSRFATRFNWSFPGGSPESSTSRNTQSTFSENGTFLVTLVASRGGNSDTITKEVVITGLGGNGNGNNDNGNDDQDLGVNAGFSLTVSIVNNQARVTLNNESENADNFQWSFPGGTPSSSTLENPVVIYPQNGTFTISLTASNNNDSDTSTQTVTINDIVDFDGNDDDIIDVRARFFVSIRTVGGQRQVTMINRSRNATDFEWSFPGGNPESSTEVNPVVIYPAGQQRTITLIARNGDFSDTRTVTLSL